MSAICIPVINFMYLLFHYMLLICNINPAKYLMLKNTYKCFRKLIIDCYKRIIFFKTI